MKKSVCVRWRLLTIVFMCYMLTFVIDSRALGATADSFRTAEYRASTGLEIINAADAYAQGYTGKGITLGICDLYVKLSHPEFAPKDASSTLLPVPANFDWNTFAHGTRVAGIMAADKDNIGMHGMAFDANLVSGTWFDPVIYEKTGIFVKTFQATYGSFNNLTNVKIINNSWGIAGPGSLYMEWQGANKSDMLQFYGNQGIDVSIFATSINNYDKVLVFAAGNSGHTSPHAFALLPYTLPDTAKNFLIATMVDPANFNKVTNTANTYFLGMFSDLTKYAEENSIAAPGWNINSTVAAGNTYGVASGTSFSAPHVAATAGLVQQAFPYMNGKQIVDTVLSSANNTFMLPTFTVTMQNDYPAGQSVPQIKFNVFYFDDQPNAATIISNLTQFYNDQKAILESTLWKGITLNEFLNMNRTIYDNVPREMIFGQGLLDAAAAVRGPAVLNARRMDSTNFSPASAYNKDQALYVVDTQGYNSVWSNNIGEKRAEFLSEQNDPKYADLQAIYRYYRQGDQLNNITSGQDYIDTYNAKVAANGLRGLPVGLLKTGEGILALTGTNTYQGSSVVTAGVLQIDGSVVGDVFSVGSGTVSGSGYIGGNLNNHYLVQAGSYGSPGTLTVDGNFISNGQIAVPVTNGAYSKIRVNGAAAVDGTSFRAVPGSIYQPDFTYIGVITASSVVGAFTDAVFTGMLSAGGSCDGTSANLNVYRANNLGDMSWRQGQSYNWVQSIYTNLQGQMQQRELDQLYNFNPVQAKAALTEIYGGAQINQAAITQRDTSVQKAVTARIASVSEKKVSAGKKITIDSSLPQNTIIPLEFGNGNDWWANISQGWGTVDADADLPALNNQVMTCIIGHDKKIDNNWRVGFLLAYIDNQVSSTMAQTQSMGMKFGSYAGYNCGAVSGMLYLDYGKQNNNAVRYLQNMGLQANSAYGSQTANIRAMLSYMIQENRKECWRLSPYISSNIGWYTQDAFQENGAGVFNQLADTFQNIYSNGEIGLEWMKKVSDGQLLITVGYRRVFSGNNPSLAFAYSGDINNRLLLNGNAQDDEYAVFGVDYQGKLTDRLMLNAQITGESGQLSNNTAASIMFYYLW